MENMRKNIFPLLFCASFFLLLCLGVMHIANAYTWQFGKVWPHIITFDDGGVLFGVLLTSLGVTIKLVAVSLVLALVLGLVLAGMNISSSPVAHLLAKSFIGIVRNTPLLMQLYLVYFVLAPLLSLDAFFAACIAIACFEGAYMAEIFRAGFNSVPFTQWEASFSLGFNTFQSVKFIILPQAVNNVLPSLIGQIVSLIKDTSLVSAISVADLTLRASELISETYLSFEIWLIVAALYLLLTSSVSIPLAYYERRSKKNKS